MIHNIEIPAEWQGFFIIFKCSDFLIKRINIADDIVKAHGGELKVKIKEGKGSEFIIQLMAN